MIEEIKHKTYNDAFLRELRALALCKQHEAGEATTENASMQQIVFLQTRLPAMFKVSNWLHKMENDDAEVQS